MLQLVDSKLARSVPLQECNSIMPPSAATLSSANYCYACMELPSGLELLSCGTS